MAPKERTVIVDAHAHVIPPEVRSALAVDVDSMPNVRHEFVDAEGILATLAGFGVEGAILAPHVGLLRYGDPADRGLASSQVQNDAIAAIVRQHPGRVAGLGIVPMQDPALAVGELE